MVVDFSNYGYEYDISQLLKISLQKFFFFFFASVLLCSGNQCPQNVRFTQPSHLKHCLWGLSLYDCCFWVFGTMNLPYGYQVKLNWVNLCSKKTLW